MQLSRRRFAGLTAGWSAAALLGAVPAASRAASGDPATGRPHGQGEPQAPRFFKWERLDPAGAAAEPGAVAYACLPPSPELMSTGGNGLLLIGKEQALLVDTRFPALGRSLRLEAQAIARSHGAAVTHVVNTHHHLDHTGGNIAFMGEVALYAHANALTRIIAPQQFERYAGSIDGTVALVGKSGMPGVDAVLDEAARVKADFEAGALKPESFAPTRTVSRDTSLDIGGVEVWLRHFGPGHTDNDLIVHCPTLNLLHTGDLVFHRLHPFMDAAAGSTSTGWQKALTDCDLLCDDATVVIPGHGEVTDRTGIRGQSHYFTKLREIVRYARDVDGMTREEAVKITTGAFEGFGLERMLANSIGVIYDELSK